MDITPLQSVIATAAFIILAMSLFYKWMRDLSRDLKTEIQQTRIELNDTRTELTQKIDDTRTELTQKIDDTRTELNQKIDDTRTELTQKIDDTRTELTQKIDVARTEAREDNTALREELRTEVRDLRTEIKDLRASVEIRMQGTEMDRARAEAAFDLLRSATITAPAVPTAPANDDD